LYCKRLSVVSSTYYTWMGRGLIGAKPLSTYTEQLLCPKSKNTWQSYAKGLTNILLVLDLFFVNLL